MRSIEQLRDRVNCLRADFHHARKAYREEKKEVERLEALLLDAQEAQKICQVVAQTIQQQAHKRITDVVSRCLAAVFDAPYHFKILFEQKRGRTEARLVFERDGLEVDPMTASGGGVVDVAAFALRLSCLLLSKPAPRRVLFLDEPFKFVSKAYRDRVRMMLEKLSEDLKVQIVMVTHEEAYKTGKVIEL